MRFLVDRIILIGLVIIFIWIGYVTFLNFQPFKAPIIKQDPMPIVTKQVPVGGTVQYVLDYCIFEKVETTTTRQIEEIGGSQRVYFLAATNSPGVEPTCDKKIINIQLSSDIGPGKYRIVTTGRYQVNKVQTESKTFKSEEFEIIK